MNYFKQMLSILLLSFVLLQAKNGIVFKQDTVHISLSNIEIKKLIELFSKISKKNILIPNEIRGRITFISSAPIYKDEIFEIVLNVLNYKGYTIVKDGNFLKVVRLSEATRNNLEVYEPKEHINSSGLMVTKQITLKSISASTVASKIRQFLSKTGRLTTIKESNAIFVSDFPKNIKTIQKVITLIENKRKNIVEILEIKHAKLSNMYTQSLQIAKILFNPSIPYNKVSILKNKELNSLIIIGAKKNVKKLKDELLKLDKERIKEAQIIKIIALKNIDAKSAFTTLSQIISKRKYKDTENKPNISYSKEINAIILIGKPEIIQPLKMTLKELDKEKYQVYVQAKIIEISEQKAKQIGIKYGLIGGDVTSSSLLTFSSNFGTSALSVAKDISGYFSDFSNISANLALNAAISFLQTNGASQTISNPSILCVNNLESSIYVGKNKSFLTGKTTNTSGTTTSYQREDIGLTLKVKPRVASNDKVTLQVNTILENVDTSDKSEVDRPTTTKQEVKTQVIVANGESIVIGGLLQNTRSVSQQKIPLLGDIPMIGGLFRHKETSSDKKSIIVVLTPYIISKSSSLGKLQKFLAIYGKIQKEYNKNIFMQIEKKAQKDKPMVKKQNDITFDTVVNGH